MCASFATPSNPAIAQKGRDVPSRILRDGILTSDRVDLLSAEAEVFYRRLMSVVDDFGRFEAKLVRLRSSCYPLRVDAVSDQQVSGWIDVCEKAGLITRYEVCGKAYLLMLDFKQQIRAKTSKYPDPPEIAQHLLGIGLADAQHLKTNVHLDVDVDVDEGVCGSDRSAPANAKRINGHAKAPRKTGLPKQFMLSDRVVRWAKAKGYKRMPERLEHFVGRAKAKGYQYVDWDEAFMESVRQDWAKLDTDGGKSVKVSTDL